jgi:hypothetical protein
MTEEKENQIELLEVFMFESFPEVKKRFLRLVHQNDNKKTLMGLP